MVERVVIAKPASTFAQCALTLTLMALAAAGAAHAQPRGYYPDPWSAAYAYRYEPPLAYGPDGRAVGVFANGYDSFHIDTLAPYAARRVRVAQPPAEPAPPAPDRYREPPARSPRR